MRRLLLTLTALLLGLTGLAATSSIASAGGCSQYVADCEGPPAALRVTGSTTRMVVGHRPQTQVTVKQQGSARLTGSIMVVYRDPDGGRTWRRSASYDGEVATVVGPRLQVAGRWSLTVEFVTDGGHHPAHQVTYRIRVTRR
ncbi:hypothetical protein GCM10009795_002090 [Nocardioides hankookensis]|uniref:YtkA-like domain-containing protein n=1 Tax=Nocardioides hankookensis TaxID=443157 RepID=A0ABW1LKN5_9ACTN